MCVGVPLVAFRLDRCVRHLTGIRSGFVGVVEAKKLTAGRQLLNRPPLLTQHRPSSAIIAFREAHAAYSAVGGGSSAANHGDQNVPVVINSTGGY